jgi:integration host factor subunit beta
MEIIVALLDEQLISSIKEDIRMLNKAILLHKLKKQTDLSLRELSVCVNILLDTMAESISHGERIELRGFGAFEVKTVSSRITFFANVPSHGRIVFRPCQKLRDSAWNYSERKKT